MENMILKRHFVGCIDLSLGAVDITDPCYGKDVWCRRTENIMPGTYNCYAYIGDDPDWGSRVWINQIVIADGEESYYAEDRVSLDDAWEEIGEIGVDAGMAGFFQNKPDFNDDEWDKLCSWLFDKTERHNPEGVEDSYVKSFRTGDGFWTHSGCGDGCYGVFAIKKDDKIVALEIRF